MKRLLLALLLLPFISVAQEVKIPIDSASQKISYSGVVKVEGVSKDDLYTRSREWFARTFKSAKAVIQMDDKAAGKIIGKGYAEGSYVVLISAMKFDMWYTVSITVKDGRYRYELSDFTFQDRQTQYMTNPQVEDADKIATDATYKNKKGEYKSPWKGQLASMDKFATGLVEDLKKAMAGAPSGAKSKDDF